MGSLAGSWRGVWDLAFRGISDHGLHMGDVTFADLCISMISDQHLRRR